MKIFLPKDVAAATGVGESSGISIEYVKSKRRLDISGWYDSFVGIPPSSLELGEFFRLLGITKKDCDRAFAVED